MNQPTSDASPRPLQGVPHSPFGILLSRDLFFGSKVTGTAQALGLRVEMLGDVSQLREKVAAPGCRLVLFDLSFSEVSPAELMSGLAAGENRPKVVAFGAHVQTSLLEAARDAGCDEVMPRSKFSATLPEILRAGLS